MRSTCGNCGNALNPSEYTANYCGLCTSAINEAQNHAAAEGKDTAAARREALMSRAHHAFRNFQDPRGFNKVSGGSN